MSNPNTFRNLLFRVHLRPAPRTQSESSAVLRALQDFGPVSLFQIIRNNSEGRLASVRSGSDARDESAIANLAFARNTKALDGLRKGTDKASFTVTANANIPDVAVRDPYNIRGLKSRKPELGPREIECRIESLHRTSSPRATHNFGRYEHEHEPEQKYDDCAHHNKYSGAFAVDRNSIFGEILAKTDCPSGLITGLLPKLKDEHRSQAYNLSQARSKPDIQESVTGNERQGLYDPGFRHDVRFLRLNLDARNEGVTHGLSAAVTRGPGPRSESKSKSESESQSDLDPGPDVGRKAATDKAQFYDEFAALRNVSLMQMYREAVKGDDDVSRRNK